MPPTGFLIPTADGVPGEPHALAPGLRCTLGRAPDNAVVLRDDLCSRHHAEIDFVDGEWVLRDLGSLNGTAVNDHPCLGTTAALEPGDTLRLGRSTFLFLTHLSQAPNPLAATVADADVTVVDRGSPTDDLTITERLSQTQFTPTPPTSLSLPALEPQGKPRPSTAEASLILGQLVEDFGRESTRPALADMTLKTLLRATPAEVAAVLTLREGRDLELVAHRRQPTARPSYYKVSEFVSREVLSTQQAILAEDIAAVSTLKSRESLSDLKAASLICAPVLVGGRVGGLVHLYRVSLGERLTAVDLDFTLAVAQQLGRAWQRVARPGPAATVVSPAPAPRLAPPPPPPPATHPAPGPPGLASELVGVSPALRAIHDTVRRVAASKATVLVRGETGVGKELVARAIHLSSPRAKGPFICLNCAALTETLLESELFGHEKGSFTGATDRLIGKFEAAHEGTIFLDEIGEIGRGMQAKLLRVLEGQPFERVGGTTPIRVNVRVVAATNRGLEEGVKDGTFRPDLYYRLQVVQLDVPPLRHRPEDVPPLAEFFRERYAKEAGRAVSGFTPEAMKMLQAHPWPGNVRELRNTVERAVVLGDGPRITADDVWLAPAAPTGSREFTPLSLEEIEKQHILETLTHTQWNKSRAAELLGIERSTLDRKIKAYELKKADVQGA